MSALLKAPRSAPHSKPHDLSVKPVDAPDAAERLSGPQVERALVVAYSYLNKRERTTAEVAGRLRREGFVAETIDGALAALHEDGSLDDHRFARLFTEDKRQLEQWGSERIRRTLAERGIDSETVAAALAADEAPDMSWESERERALALLRRRFPEPPRNRRDRDRALGALLRKGYEPELAFEVVSAHSRG